MSGLRAAASLLLLVLGCGAAGPTPAPPPTEIDLTQAAVGVRSTAASADPELLAPPAAFAEPSSREIPVGGADARWGSPSAPVTLVEFLDLECPFCAKVQPTLQALMREYGAEKLRVVWKHDPLPFHEHARAAAAAAQAVLELAGPDTFRRYAELLFRFQSTLDDASLARFAEEVGVASTALFARARAPHVAGKIDADIELGRRLGETGTPAFRINGASIEGSRPIEEFRAVVDQELAEAAKLRAQGTAVEEIYARRVAVNHPLVVAGRQKPRRHGEEDTRLWKVPIGKSPQLGPKDAPVTIVEFSDFQCPFCARVQPTLDELLRRHATELRLVWKHRPLPFHPRATPAAMLAIEARAQQGDAGFWKMATELFLHQEDLEDESLIALGKQLGLNPWRVKNAIRKSPHQSVIDADEDLADDVKASGTPHFFINGRRLSVAQPIEDFERLIAEELRSAERLRQAGSVAPAKLYDAIIKDGLGSPSFDVVSVAAAPRASPSRGPAAATVEIQMFSDFQCPFCKRVTPTLRALQNQFPGQVRVVWRNLPLPFHKDARNAAAAALEALAQRGQKAFWRMHDRLFEQQSQGLDNAALEQHALALGLDVSRFRKALEDGRHDAAIDADLAAAAAAGITGTPSFAINGYLVVGNQPLGKLKKVVRRALDDRAGHRKPLATR